MKQYKVGKDIILTETGYGHIFDVTGLSDTDGPVRAMIYSCPLSAIAIYQLISDMEKIKELQNITPGIILGQNVYIESPEGQPLLYSADVVEELK